jgi:hypothetical protein
MKDTDQQMILDMVTTLKDMIQTHIIIAEKDLLHDTPSVIYRLGRDLMRKNNTRAQAIAVLNTYEKLSDSSLEITRNMIEDVISYSYILSDNDPEKLAETFFEFRWVQLKQDYDYYSKLGAYKDPDHISLTKIKSEYSRVMNEYPEFKRPDGSPSHSWSKNGIEGMSGALVKRKVYPKDEMRNIMRMYQRGSRKTHFNPQDLLNYADQEKWDKESFDAARGSILTAAASLISLTIRYYDTIAHYDPELYDNDAINALYGFQQKIQSYDK